MTVKNIGIVINFNPKSWVGGSQYFKNVHQICKNSKYTLNIICNKKNYNQLKKEFIDVKFILTDIFDLDNSKQRIFSKLKILLFGKDNFLENFLTKKNIHYFMYSGFLGRNSKIINIPIIWDFQEIINPSNFSFRERILRSFNHYMCLTNSSKVILGTKHDQNIFSGGKHKNKKKSYLMNMPDPLTDFKLISKKKILDKYKIKNQKYYILPNQYWKHKNHILALKALESLESFWKKKILIVSTGASNDWRYLDYFKYIKSYILEKNLKKNYQLLGLIDRNDLFNLIYYSIGLIQPSQSEGESGSVEMAKSFNKITLLSAIDVHKEQLPKRSYFYDIDDHKKLSNYLIRFYQEFNLIKEKKLINKSLNDNKKILNKLKKVFFKLLKMFKV
jgi:hypothetical protein